MSQKLSAKEVCDFEKDQGTDKLLKASVSVINRVLVERGIVTKNELKHLLKQEIHKIS